ncbi:3854_t:CDS:2 [Funneliformis caledonium]|uniref:3854_t:CDS:1 n=1 Tax=Funneliformis caledonium TaxID=1117310 RepID=A0A9N9ED26_9GLOM|nr:3854_t:CDS:2 [Funneliformis caledonium]
MGSKLSTFEHPDLNGKVVIITGATAGVGKSLAAYIASYNPKKLILPVRNLVKGEATLEHIRLRNGHSDNVELWEMDLADLTSVKSFAEKFIKEVGELHLLFNNAGLAPLELMKTKNNFEVTFQVNYLSQFLLTNLLLDTLKKTTSPEFPCKIIHTSSKEHRSGTIDFDNFYGRQSSINNYVNTKLMVLIFSNELNRRLQGTNITSIAVHPGLIKPKAFHIYNKSRKLKGKLIHGIFMLLAKSPDYGALQILIPTFSKGKQIHLGYNYYENCKEVKPNDKALNEALAKKLWDHSDKLLKSKISYTPCTMKYLRKQAF